MRGRPRPRSNTRMPELLVEGDRIGLQLAHLDGTESTPALDYRAAVRGTSRRRSPRGGSDLYVAMTRARERLLLSGALELPARSCESANPTIISGSRRRCSATSTSSIQPPPEPASRASSAAPSRAGRTCVACSRRRRWRPGCRRRGTGPERAPRHPPRRGRTGAPARAGARTPRS